MAKLQPVTMEYVKIIFRNFKGKEGKYNREGDRNFGVILPEDVAEAMLRDGWNVKRLKPSEEEQEAGLEQGPPWLPVSVNYDKGRPPRIIQITSRGKLALDEQTVEALDIVDIKLDEEGRPMVDLIVNPHPYDVNGNSGIKAYLQAMYVTIEEDALERKYAEMNAQ